MEGLNNQIFRVKFIADDSETCLMETGKIYEVKSVERGLYRIDTDIDESYLYNPDDFEIVSGTRPEDIY